MERAEFEKMLRDTLARKDEFHRAFDAAMVAWGGIEIWLCHWFTELSGLEAGSAKRLFYSARNFDTRREMFKAIIPRHDHPRNVYFVEVAKKSQQYAAARNVIAHSLYSMLGSRDSEEQLLALVDLKDERNFFTLEHLYKVTVNFGLLSGSMKDMVLLDVQNPEPPYQREAIGRQIDLIKALPNKPQENPPDACLIIFGFPNPVDDPMDYVRRPWL